MNEATKPVNTAPQQETKQINSSAHAEVEEINETPCNRFQLEQIPQGSYGCSVCCTNYIVILHLYFNSLSVHNCLFLPSMLCVDCCMLSVLKYRVHSVIFS